MLDYQTLPGMMKLVGLVGLALSLCTLAFAELSGGRKRLVPVCAGAALLLALIYFLGVLATADSGLNRFVPRFP